MNDQEQKIKTNDLASQFIPNNVEQVLPSFFRNLAQKIESEHIDYETLSAASNFYMSQMFSENTQENIDFSDEDFKKFLVLGWYIYTNILPVQNGPK